MTKPAKSASVGGLGAPLSRFCAAPAGAGAAAAAGAPLWPGLAAFPGYPPLFVQHLLSLQAAGTSLFAAAADTADDEPLNLTVSGADRDRVKATAGERTNGKLPPPQPAQRVSPTGQKDRPVKKRKGSPEEPEGKRKKARTTFTGHQIFELERQFEIKRYLASAERTEMAKRLDVTETQVKIWFQNRRTKWKKAEQEAAAVQKAATEKQSITTGQTSVAETAVTKVTEGKQSTETSSSPASDGKPASVIEAADSKQSVSESGTGEQTSQPTVDDAEKSSDGATDGSEKSVDSPVEVTNSETEVVGTSAPTVSTTAAGEDVKSMEVTSQNTDISSDQSPSPTSSGDGEATNSVSDYSHSSRDSTPAPPSGPTQQTEVHSPADGGATVRPVAGRLLAGALGVGPAGRPRSGLAKLERLVFQREREAALCGES